MSLDILGWGQISSLINNVIDKVVPDPAQKAQAQLALLQLQQSGELAQLASDTQLAQGQLDINKAEAASNSLFVAGWRPFMGWVGGLGFLYQVMICPIGSTIITNYFHWSSMPQIDTESLNTVLWGLLGLGAYRSVDKGVAALVKGR